MGRCPKPHRGGSSSPDPASDDSLLSAAEQSPRPSNLNAKNRSRAGQQSWPACALCAQEKRRKFLKNEFAHFIRNFRRFFMPGSSADDRNPTGGSKLGLRFAQYRQPASLQLSSPGRKRVPLSLLNSSLYCWDGWDYSLIRLSAFRASQVPKLWKTCTSSTSTISAASSTAWL